MARADPESYLLPEAPERDAPADVAGFVDWMTLDLADLGAEPDALGRMLDGDLDGITVHEALDPDVARRVVAALETVQPSVYAEMGAVAPMPLLAVVDDFEPYLQGAADAAASVDEAFGRPVADLVTSTVSRIAGGLPVAVAASRGRRYLPGTLRTAAPGHGGLRAHCANLFHEMNRERGLRQLDEHLDLVDGISWFYVLQAPEAGGDLRLFDARWPDDPTRRPEGVTWADDDTGVESLPSAVVPPRVGDLVVFRGGDLWHAVDDVDGGVSRVTYGGFLAPRRDGTAYELWS
jgi:hypothetical protein